MRVGLIIPNDYPTGARMSEEIQASVELVQVARGLGFHALLHGEHRLSTPYQYCSPLPVLSRLAAEAGGMHLVAMCLLSLHNPVDVAEDGATVDAISGGRFILAAALGYRDIEFAAYRVVRGQRVERLVESLDILEQLWRQPFAEYHGKHFTVPATTVSTRPTRPGGPRIWLAANQDPAIRRAGNRGLPWLMSPHTTISAMARQRRVHEDACAEVGVEVPEDVPAIREVVIDHDRYLAWDRARKYLAEKYETYASWGRDKVISAEEDFRQSFDELATDRFIIGSPDDCVAAINRMRETLGVTWLFIRCQWPGQPRTDAARMVRLFGEEVIPRLGGPGVDVPA